LLAVIDCTPSRGVQTEIRKSAPIVRIGSREFKCIGDKPPEDHTSISIWAMPVRSSALLGAVAGVVGI
jgi:hypothetical protein